MSIYNNQKFLEERYINNTDIDINAMMGGVMDVDKFKKDEEDLKSANQFTIADRKVLLQAGVSNHTIFAQNMVKETTSGKFFKSGQMFLNNIECESNPGYLDFNFLTTAFKTTQGLVELPIHTILKIGGIYDFYYYNDYEKDNKIDLDIVNGLKTKNGYDLFDDPIIRNKHYGTYVFDDKNLILATAPFVKPITPKHIDDLVGNSSDSFSNTNFSKNYKEKYYDYDLEVELSLSNNIASHIPFSGYGVLNNYMNAMSHFFFGQGLDGGTDITDTTNNNGIPYHIIGNFKGNLKTFKTYNDTQLNFLASYNSFGPKIKHDINIEDLKTSLKTLTQTITLDAKFVFSKDTKKTEFFLLLSKIKANYLGGYISTDYVFTIIKGLCGEFKDGSFLNNKLNAKHENIPLSDFTALLIHLLFYPDGTESDSIRPRPNKTLRILSLYDVDPNSFMPIITYDTKTISQLTDFLTNIIIESPEKQYEQVAYLLLSLWSKEFNRKISDRLSKIDEQGDDQVDEQGKGTYVVYPSCGGEINIKELFSNKNYTYNKTNNVSTVIEKADLSDSYITGLTTSSFTNIGTDNKRYDNISNDVLSTLNFDYKTFYGNLPNNISIDKPPIADFLDIKSLAGTLKYSEKATKPNSIEDNNKFFLDKYKKTVVSNLDRYDDLYITANTTDPAGIKELYFDNRNLINNTSKLFWFDQTRNVFPITRDYVSQNGQHLVDVKVYDNYEVLQYGYDGDIRQLYDWGNPSKDILNITDYSKFEKDKSLYFSTKWFTIGGDDKEIIKSVTTAEIDALIDIFGVDKLEDFRSLFKNFADTDTGDYFTKTFNTFNFQSLIKHTNIFGYTNLPDGVKIGDKEYKKEEISALLCGYSGHFIEFASKNDVSKIINYALTIGQENKAKIVIDEFMNDKITINNYSTTGPLYVDNTLNNPKGLRLNSNIFNPIIMYASETRTPDNIIAKVDYRLLFRTLLFGDQPIKSYDVKTIPNDFNTLVDKYLGSHKLYSVEPTLEKILLPELTKIFFSELNIEITEGNLKLLLAYLKSYINNYIGSEEKSIISPNGFDITGLKIIGNRNATIYPSSEDAKDKEFDFTRNEYVITNQVDGGVLTKVGEVKYLFNTIDELKPVEKLREFVDYTNKNILTKQIEAFNTGLEKFSELAKSKIDTVPTLEDSGSEDEKWDENLKKRDIELRTGTYYRIKTLYDRSVSFNNIDLNDSKLIRKRSKDLSNINVNDILDNPLFFNFNIETDDTDYENCVDKNIIADKTDSKISDGRLKDLYDYAFVLDRGNNDYGSRVLANIDALKKVIADDITNVTQVDNTLRSKSMWSVLSTLASDHEFLLLPLTSYINLNGAVKNNTDPFELAHDMFGVFNNLEMFDSNPAFIFQLGSLTSNISAGNKQKKNSLSEFDLSNTFCMDIETNQLDSDGRGKILDEGVPNDILNSNVSSFIVDFGNKNQNMFQNIQLSTDEFANTEESIFTQVNLTSSSGNIAQLSTGKLFTAMENRSYSCTVTSLGNAGIQPLTYFYVKNVPLFYGTYWITNVSHKITPNNMTTTFKGVRQPISKKPTANTTILQQLLQKAEAAVVASGGVVNDQRVNGATFGPVFASNNRDSPATGTDNGFGLFAQESVQKSGFFVNYSGLWIAAAYLKLMTKNDISNKLLIKALIAYLYSNASTLIATTSSSNGGTNDPPSPATAVKYFADIIVYDLYNKIDTNKININIKKDGVTSVSISKLLSNYDTKDSDYETMLIDFQSKNDTDALEYFKHDKEIKGIKTTLIASDTGGVVADDGAKAKITYPDDITVPAADTDLFRGASYWVSDKQPNNVVELQGFSRYQLTNELYNTTSPPITSSYSGGGPFINFKISDTDNINDPLFSSIPKKYFVVVKYLVRNQTNQTNQLGGPLQTATQTAQYDRYNQITNINGERYKGKDVIPSPNLFPQQNTSFQPFGNNNPSKEGYFGIDPNDQSLGIAQEFVVIRNNTEQSIVIDEASFSGSGKLIIEVYTPYKTRDGFPITRGNTNPDNISEYKSIGYQVFNYNNIAGPQRTNNTPVVLGFGAVTTNNGKFTYGKSFSNKYNRGGNDYLADVLGAIKNGNSYVSFLSIRLFNEKSKPTPERTRRSYIDLSVLGDTNNKKAWTIENKTIDTSNLYITTSSAPSTNSGNAGTNRTRNNRTRNNNRNRTTNRATDVNELKPVPLNNAMYIKNYLKGKGFSKEEVAATLGNMFLETIGTFNPTETNGKDLNGTISIGLIQWNGGNINGLNISDSEETQVRKVLNVIGNTVQAQLDYLVEKPNPNGWADHIKRFRTRFKQDSSTLDISALPLAIRNRLSEKELEVYKAAYFFAKYVEICYNCNGNFATYHKTVTVRRNNLKYTVSPFKRSGYAVDFYKKMNDRNDPLYFESTSSQAQPTTSSPAQPTTQSQSTSSNAVRKAVTIGDSISLLIHDIYKLKNLKLIETPKLSEKNRDASWLLVQLDKIQNPFNDVKTVILSIGSNNGFKITDTDKKLINKIKEVFPEASYYILNGSYGWDYLARGGTDWVKEVNKYIKVYKDGGFDVIGSNFNDVIKLGSHPKPGDDLLKSFDSKIDSILLNY